MAKSTVKFKDCDAEFRKICADIESRKYAPVYLLTGEEPYFIDVIADKIATTVLNEAERAFNQVVLYGRDTDGSAVASQCRQIPMIGGYTVVIVKEAQAMPKIELLAAYTANPVQSTILVICHKEKSPDKRQSLYKSCVANGVVLETVRPKDYEITGWLGGFVAQHGLQLAPNCAQTLVDHLGTDISRISNELNKLIVSIPQGCSRITATEIETYIGISKEFNVFELCNAVMVKDIKRAMNIADHLSQNTKSAPLTNIIASLFGTFHDLFIIEYLRWLERAKRVPFPTEQELLGILKGRNIYAMRDMTRCSQLWPRPKLFSILGVLREYDGKSKGINSGGKSDGELLTELLLKIFL